MRTLLVVALCVAVNGCGSVTGPSPAKSEAQVESLQQMLDRQEMEFRLRRILKEEHEQRAPHKR